MNDAPLVTIGIPSRNGSRTLSYAIKSACAQNYPNLEVVISDNASVDDTFEIASDFASSDPRVRVVRQEEALTMLGNHKAVWHEAKGKYFVWLADDDLLCKDFVSLCTMALENEPKAVLAFGDVIGFSDYEGMTDAEPLPIYDFSTKGQPGWRRLIKDRHSGYEMKGLFRTETLRTYRWSDHTVSPDWPILTFLMLAGEVIRVPGATMCSGAHIPKSGADRAARQSFSRIERFPTLTLSLKCGLAAKDAAKTRGERRWILVDGTLTFVSLLWVNRRWLVQRAIEPWVQRYRTYRGNRGPA